MHGRMTVAVFALAVMGACSDAVRTPTQPETLTANVQVTSASHAGTAHNHRTHLSGEEEVFTPAPGALSPADSLAQGQAIFQVSPNGASVDYRLIASNIENITQAHIHCAPAGTNGPIVMWLYPSPTVTVPEPGGAGRHDGVLAEGTFTNAHVLPTSAAECPGGVQTLASLLNRIREGNAYVNVHTSDGVAPPNTGPGDFPGGELRGQIK
jgi:CHRD domain